MNSFAALVRADFSGGIWEGPWRQLGLWFDAWDLSSIDILVEHYTEFLEAQWEAHQALAQRFTPGEESPLTREQLRTLRSLGYIR